MRTRKLTRAERFALYGATGWVMEVVFTAASQQLDRSGDRKLQGHTYLWMLPIYGLTAVLFDPVQRRVAHRPPIARSAAYASAFIGVEYVSGALLRRVTGVCPWDYTGRSRFVVDGVTRLDYAPLWAVAGLGVERLDRLFDRVRIVEGAAE